MKLLFYTLISIITYGVLFAESDDIFKESISSNDIEYANIHSKEFLKSELLESFEEKRLDEGAEEDTIRITVLRSFHDPLMFIWEPRVDEVGSKLIVKKVKLNYDNDKNIVYGDLLLDKTINLNFSNSKKLYRVLALSNVYTLNPRGWQPDTLDGSVWIYELVSEKSSVLLVRKNPIQPIFKGVEISKENLFKESNLTFFAVMLWVLSDIKDPELY